ncbi:hypothetical protein SUGI_0201530 [Cryptomeria japonica]|nr:hypothetical protein SUGI_0201530 [Cryptomeria japonica]
MISCRSLRKSLCCILGRGMAVHIVWIRKQSLWGKHKIHGIFRMDLNAEITGDRKIVQNRRKDELVDIGPIALNDLPGLVNCTEHKTGIILSQRQFTIQFFG